MRLHQRAEADRRELRRLVIHQMQLLEYLLELPVEHDLSDGILEHRLDSMMAEYAGHDLELDELRTEIAHQRILSEKSLSMYESFVKTIPGRILSALVGVGCVHNKKNSRECCDNNDAMR